MSLRISTGLRNRMLGIYPEKLANSDFETGTTGWTGSGASLTQQAGGANGTTNALRVTGSGGAGYAYATATCRNGHVYRLKAWFKKGTGTTGTIRAGTTQGGSELVTKSVTDAAWTLHTLFFLVPGTLGGTTPVFIGLHVDTDTMNHDYDLVSLTSMSKAVQDIFRGGEMKIYTGLQPSSADDAPTGTLLVTIKNSTGAGVTWDDAVNGVLTKAAAETWNGVCVATGTAGWARFQTPSDGGASSGTDERMDMSVGTSGAQINMSSTQFATGATQTLTALSLTLPAY